MRCKVPACAPVWSAARPVIGYGDTAAMFGRLANRPSAPYLVVDISARTVPPGSIQISATSYELIKDGFVCEPRGPIEVKGKATMQTYLLLSRRDAATWTDRGPGARSGYIE